MNSRLEFPIESVQRAREVASIYKRRSKSRLTWAANLYDGHFLEIGYGFSEALRNGNCGQYLHEIVKEAECFTKAVADYLIARELGLDPVFYWASDMKDLAEGDHANEKGISNHAFITVQAKKDREQLVDKNMSAYGEVSFPDTNEMRIFDRSNNKIITRKYASLSRLSEQEVLEKIEQNRSKEGGRLALSGSQRVRSHGNDLYIGFDSKTGTLSSRLNFSLEFPRSEPYSKSEIHKLETKVREDGTFDFSEGSYISYKAGAWGWSHHLNEQEPIVISTSVAETSWDLVESVMKENPKRKRVRNMGTRRLRVDLNSLGLNYDFSTRSNSKAQIVVERDFSDEIRSLKWHQTRSVNEFIERAKKDDITWRTFLRSAQYRKARDQRTSDDNPFGYVFTPEKHEQFMVDQFESYREECEIFTRDFIDTVKINAGFKPGTNFKAVRRRNELGRRHEKDAEFFNDLLKLRKVRNEPYAFQMKADETLFFQNFDIANDPISKIKKGLSDRDLLMAGKDLLFEALLLGASRRKTLFARQYYPGLKKILDRTI